MISLDNNTLTFGVSGGDVQINYTSNNPISREAIILKYTWADAKVVKKDNKSGHILIHVSSNTGNKRSVPLILTAYDNVEKKQVSATIEVNQLSTQDVGSISIKSIEIDGQKVTSLTVDGNVHILKVTLETSLIDTVNVLNTSSWMSLYSQGNNEYTFNISASTEQAEREATITFDAVDVAGTNLFTSIKVSQLSQKPVRFSVDDLHANNTQKEYYLTVKSQNVVNYEITDHPSWVEILSKTERYIKIKVLSNPTYKDREGKIVYSVTDEPGNSYTFSSNVFQLRSVFTGQYPTWRDVFVVIPRTSDDESNINYSVSILDDKTNTFEVVYRGNAVFTEGAEPEINITEIVRDYVEDNINIDADRASTQEANLTKVMLSTEEPEPNLVATLYYYYDYSFDKDYKFTRNMPILNYFDTRQDIFLSFLNLSEETQSVSVFDSGNIIYIELDKPGIFHYKNAYLDGNVTINTPYTTTTLISKNTCAKYAIYYLNPRGGWDQLLIEGKVVKNIKLENKTFKINFDNSTNEFQNKHYLKNLTTSYKLTTGYLTDEQAKLMPNLIETTKAYLCELDTNTYIPVLINNNSVDIKTYRNQGRKLFTYTIDVQESQNKFIK